MSQKAPGKAFRKGLSLIEITRMFPDDKTAERWFADTRWPDGPRCPYCDSEKVQSGATHKTMPYRCRSCRKRFSVKTGTVMQASNLGYQTWAIAIYLIMTNLKGVSSMKLHRDLGISQKSAWHLAHRLREAWRQYESAAFMGPVEVDECYMGGLERNKHNSKKSGIRGGIVGKTAVIGMKDRNTNKVTAAAIARADQSTLQGFVMDHIASGAEIYTDDHRGYHGLPNHQSVKHSVGEYVDGMAHTNGIESFWAMLKRGYNGTYHKMSAEHLDRYVNEFSGRHNLRMKDTADQMTAVAQGMNGKQLRYQDLIGKPAPSTMPDLFAALDKGSDVF